MPPREQYAALAYTLVAPSWGFAIRGELDVPSAITFLNTA